MELIERVKKVGDKMSEVESIFKLVEQSLIEVVDHLGIYSVRKHSDGTYSAGVDTIEALEELANGAELKVKEFNYSLYPFEVLFVEDGVKFYTLITEEEYLKHFVPKEEPEDDTEYVQARKNEEKRKMKEAGHRSYDFYTRG